ncbi:apple protein [Diplodia corticola]|uniref:Apple protein n=1 Tax=Diplodia corticola TaxID=236234 RepID=A0A1J9S7L6_9PEZI|nr:apple protein [Diplodia corticola]OJD35908.1 apple protein [Diplodia corticola]
MASLLSHPTLILGLLAAQSFAVPAPLPSATNAPVKRTDLSCWDKASDGQVFQATNAQWDIVCGSDYAGGDMGTSWVNSFEECIQDCDATTDCVDVSFVWPNACYKKNVLGTASAVDSVWTARKKSSGTGSSTSASTALSCDNSASDGVKYTSSKGTFLVECGVDYAGGDMGSSNTASFAACIEDCASTDGCIDVSYVTGSCYKKNVLNDPVSLSYVWSAKLVASDTDSSSTATITSAATTAAATATATALTCPSSNGTITGMSTGGTYEILCAIDYAGGDFKEVDTPTFEECLEACDDNEGCVAISYVAPSCYLKSELMTPVAVSYVWGAVVKKSAKDIYTFPTVADQPLEAGATESMMGEPMTLESPPLATLGPVAPPGINMGGLKVLTPDPTTELWYNGDDDAMADEDSGAVTVRLTIEYMYPSVVLDHSMYITSISCAGGVLTGTFTEQTPFLHAATEWPAQAPILLISSESSCGNGAQNAFWLASSVSFDLGAMTFSAPGESVELADIYSNMDIDFGNIDYDTDADNSTSSDDGTTSCGSPSSPFLDDLPAVDCGADFDQALDDALGYYSANGADQQIVLAAAGVPADDESNLAKRGWFTSLIKAVVKVAVAVVKVVAVVVQAVANVVVAVVTKAVEVVKVVVQAVVAVSIAVVTQVAKLAVFIATGNYSNSLTLPVSLGPPASVLTESPWGTDGFKFYEYTPEEGGSKWEASAAALEKIQTELVGEADPEPGIELWCVDCGVRGKIVATGSISATPLSGLKKGSIGISGNMYAGVFLGVNAFTQWEKTVRKDLFVKGLPGWSIPGIVSLGPRLILAAQATISVEAEGQLLTGASLNWPNFQATLDFVDKSQSSQSGWTPELTKKFEAHGEVTATAALGLPVIVNFGINILNGVFEKGINLTDFPAITAEATFEADFGTDKNQLGSDDCEGIDWDISLTNELRLDVSDGPGFTLKQWASPALASGCIGASRDGDDSDDEATTTTSAEVPEPTVEDLSLKCPAADGTTYTDPNLNTYTIKCHIDAPGGEIATSLQSNFDDCIAYCGAMSGCIGVSWVPNRSTSNNCFAKSVIGTQYNSDTNSGYEIDMAIMNNPFTILSMIYADRDITAAANNNIVKGQQLVINTNTISSWAGDPWGGNTKSIFLLYMYGAETRTFVSHDGQGTFTINPGSVQWPSEIVPTTGQSWGVYNLQIVAVAYGINAITSTSVWSNIYYAARYSGQWQFTNSNFQWDTWPGVVKSGIIWYKDLETGSFYSMAVRENNWGGFAQVKARKRDLELGAGPYSNSTDSNSTITSSVATSESTPSSSGSILLSDEIMNSIAASESTPSSPSSVLLSDEIMSSTATPASTPSGSSSVSQSDENMSSVATSQSTPSGSSSAMLSDEIMSIIATTTGSEFPQMTLTSGAGTSSNSTDSSVEFSQLTPSNATSDSNSTSSSSSEFPQLTPSSGTSDSNSTNTSSSEFPQLTPSSGTSDSNSTSTSSSEFPQLTPTNGTSDSNSTSSASSEFPQLTPTNGTSDSNSTSSASSDFPQLTLVNATSDSSNSTSDFPQLVLTNSTSDSSNSTTDFSQLSLTNSTSDSSNSTTSDFPQLTLTNSTTTSNSTTDTNSTDVSTTSFTLRDTTQTLLVNPGTNGNLFLSVLADTATDLSNFTDPGTAFTGLSSDPTTPSIFGDTSSRLLHYYPTVMAKTGASRLRLATWDDLPNGAKLITLTRVETGGVSMLLAIDADGAYFWPFFCGIKGQLNKVFLVSDPDAGAAALEAADMKFTVTGGEAYSCNPLALEAVEVGAA